MLTACGPAGLPGIEPGLPAGPKPLSIRVDRNRLTDANGRTVRLLGVNRPGRDVLFPDGGCVTRPDTESTIDVMTSWEINVVRVPLNEDCWLGINGVDPYRDSPDVPLPVCTGSSSRSIDAIST